MIVGDSVGQTTEPDPPLPDEHATSAKLEQVLQASYRAKEIIQQMLTLAKPLSAQALAVAVHRVVTQKV